MKWNMYRITYIAGFIGSVVIVLGSVITALAYSGKQGQPYSPLNHFVSELGEVGVSQAATVFNISLMIGGLCLAVFLVGLALQFNGWFRYVFGLLGLISGIAGALVGVFPMNNLEMHSLVALTFFNTGWIIVALFSIYILVTRPPRFPLWLLIPGVVTVASFLAFLNVVGSLGTEALAAPTDRLPVWDVTVFEWLLIVGLLVWVFLVSFQMWRTED